MLYKLLELFLPESIYITLYIEENHSSVVAHFRPTNIQICYLEQKRIYFFLIRKRFIYEQRISLKVKKANEKN